MKPTFEGPPPSSRGFRAGVRGLLLSLCLAAAGGSWAQSSPTDEGGDTLDTSTPAPTGMGTTAPPAAAALPDSTPEADPEPLPTGAETGGFIIPIDGDVFYEPELRVIASLPGTPPAGMVLLVDGYHETNPLSLADGLLTARLTGLRRGVHQVTLLLFNERTEIVGKQEVRFFIRLPEPVRPPRGGKVRQFGRVVAKIDWKSAEAKGRIRSQSELSLDPATGKVVAGEAETPVSQELEGVSEAAYNVKYKLAEAYGKVLLRTDEDRFRQPSDRFTASVKYGPWASLKAGDVYPLYNPLSLNGTRVRGAEGVLSLVAGETQWGSLRVVRGQSRREIPSYIVDYDTGNGSRIDTVPGAFAQTLSAARLGIGGGPRFDLGFSVLKTSDDMGSDAHVRLNNLLRGQRPAENLVPGMDLRLGFWDGRIQVYGNMAVSLYTRDRSLGAFSADSFDVAFNPEDYRDLIIFNASTRGWQYLLERDSSNGGPDIAGFIGSNSAYESGIVSSLPFRGLVTETELRYSHLGLEYHSEGNPFLGGNPGDGFTLIQKLLVLDNRVSVGMELGNYSQDLGIYTQAQRTLKVELRFSPGPYQPSFWVGGGRSNIAPEATYAHQMSSSFLNFNTGGYHQFQLPDAKLHATLLYGFTQSEMAIESNIPGDVQQFFPTTRTHIVNAMGQYKMRHIGFLPRLAYTFSHNGIQLPTHNVTMGFLQAMLEERVKLDLSGTVGQYPETNDKNDVSVGAAANIEYALGPQQTFRLREKLIQYGKRRHLMVGANYELFF